MTDNTPLDWRARAKAAAAQQAPASVPPAPPTFFAPAPVKDDVSVDEELADESSDED
jgi:hypothetical protein